MVGDFWHLDTFCVIFHQPIISPTTTFPKSAIVLENSVVATLFGLDLVCLYAVDFVVDKEIPA